MGRIRRQRDEKTGRFLPGNATAIRHAGFASNPKDIPLSVRRQVQAVKDQLVRDIAGEEASLTAAQRILIEKTINAYSVTLCMEAYIRANGLFRGKKLDPILGHSYLAFINTIRRNLEVLGISARAGEKILAPYEIVAKEGSERAVAGRSSAGSDVGQGSEGPGDEDSGWEAEKWGPGLGSAGRSSVGEG